jgi:hypothetical protein
MESDEKPTFKQNSARKIVLQKSSIIVPKKLNESQ